MKYNKHIILLLMLLHILGCNKSKEVSSIYFSGQIINPKEKKIHMFKGQDAILSTKLDTKNQFYFNLDTLPNGLYTFKHGNEFQYLYLEKSDSIVMRLNTWDFDESLVFSEKGSEKNNFLMQLFLQNENDEKLFYKFSKLKETTFLKKIDSLTNLKISKWKSFQTANIVSKDFNALLKIAVYYPAYSFRERYAENHKRLHKLDVIKPLSADFYNYRKNININDNRFLNYYAFRNYVGNYLLNTSNAIKKEDKTKQLSTILLKQVNEKIKNKRFKNEMLYNAVINCLLDHSCCEKDKKEAKHIFYNNCNDSQKIIGVKAIEKSLKLLNKNTVFPNLKVISYQDSKQEAALRTDKNTVYYFWPKEVNRIKYMARRVSYLSKNYPKFTFVGLENQLSHKKWKTLVKVNKLQNQYKLLDTTQNKWFVNEIPRAVIVGKKGIIKNDFSFLSHHNFEKLLQKI